MRIYLEIFFSEKCLLYFFNPTMMLTLSNICPERYKMLYSIHPKEISFSFRTTNKIVWTKFGFLKHQNSKILRHLTKKLFIFRIKESVTHARRTNNFVWGFFFKKLLITLIAKVKRLNISCEAHFCCSIQ